MSSSFGAKLSVSLVKATVLHRRCHSLNVGENLFVRVSPYDLRLPGPLRCQGQFTLLSGNNSASENGRNGPEIGFQNVVGRKVSLKRIYALHKVCKTLSFSPDSNSYRRRPCHLQRFWKESKGKKGFSSSGTPPSALNAPFTCFHITNSNNIATSMTAEATVCLMDFSSIPRVAI